MRRLEGAHVLVVEDDANIAESLEDNLSAEGAAVTVVGEGRAALESALERPWNLVILDVMLPGMDGITLCEVARARGLEAPVLFLTARGEVRDRIRGLRVGGDDYLPKPFHLEELLLRCVALVGRGRSARSVLSGVEFGDNRVDFRSYQATTWRGERVELSAKEAEILRLLAERAGEVVSRAEILDRVWGVDRYPSSRTVDNFIVRLRRRFERDLEAPHWLVTVRGVGYRLRGEGVSTRS